MHIIILFRGGVVAVPTSCHGIDMACRRYLRQHPRHATFPMVYHGMNIVLRTTVTLTAREGKPYGKWQVPRQATVVTTSYYVPPTAIPAASPAGSSMAMVIDRPAEPPLASPAWQDRPRDQTIKRPLAAHAEAKHISTPSGWEKGVKRNMPTA